MQRPFNPFKVIERMSSFNYTGQLVITSEAITWKIDLEKTKIKYASHSLQSLNNLELCLYRLGYGEKTLKIIEKMSQNDFTKEKGEPFVKQAIDWLIKEIDLSLSQQIKLSNYLTQDALESFFEIKNFSYYVCEEKSHFFPLEQGFHVKDTLIFWRNQQENWQQFTHLIASPHQGFDYANLNPIETFKSNYLVTKIAYSKSKITIRELGILLKLEDWEVAKLIYPDLQSGKLQLDAPLTPFNQLPPFTLSHQSLETDHPNNPIVNTQRTNNSDECKKIVCIDENEDTLNSIKLHLKSDNTNFYLVSDPNLALNQLFEIKPDLLLVDINLSGINGHQFSKIIKKSSAFQHLPIIMMSADHQKIKEAQTQDNVANDFLSKPCNQTELMTVINKHLYP
ncbi:PleD family two-component system response regulator [Cyanothece sp. BG0011]|uniref:response regulator n=1 Tax=Cyanothece sp. BG0011 TaxID=2082950 RepID=UPI000D1E248C|nr:response regulator [Cyanothece sp. BG0011]